MNTGDRKLVQTLVERLVTKLPHRTGADIEDIREDTLVLLTRDTLVEYSRSLIVDVIDAFLPLLDDLHKVISRPFFKLIINSFIAAVKGFQAQSRLCTKIGGISG